MTEGVVAGMLISNSPPLEPALLLWWKLLACITLWYAASSCGIHELETYCLPNTTGEADRRSGAN